MRTAIFLAIHYSALINRHNNTINHVEPQDRRFTNFHYYYYKGRVRVWLDHSLALQRSQTGRIVQPIITIIERPLTATLWYLLLLLLLLLIAESAKTAIRIMAIITDRRWKKKGKRERKNKCACVRACVHACGCMCVGGWVGVGGCVCVSGCVCGCGCVCVCVCV